ncbi:uncharacterized protein [Clytia hemisphaerica]|uniref:Uncharacterized protein n=1 Tax=Clytia hemisphaerica TaxID=252671 RepID=A0A7M5XJ43_9CNID
MEDGLNSDQERDLLMEAVFLLRGIVFIGTGIILFLLAKLCRRVFVKVKESFYGDNEGIVLADFLLRIPSKIKRTKIRFWKTACIHSFCKVLDNIDEVARERYCRIVYQEDPDLYRSRRLFLKNSDDILQNIKADYPSYTIEQFVADFVAIDSGFINISKHMNEFIESLPEKKAKQ